MRKRRKSTSIIAMILAILMVVSILTGVISSLVAQGTSLTEIDQRISEAQGTLTDLESQGEALEADIAQLQEQIAALRAEEGTYLEEIALLQEEMALLREKIELTEGQIDIYGDMITEKEEKLDQAVQEEAEQLELYKKRLRAMEERGSLNYIQVLLSAKSFGDLVTKMSDINEIMAYDQQVTDELEAYRESVQAYKDELEADMAELEVLIARQEAERDDLERQTDELQERIDEVQRKIDDNEIEEAELQAAREALEAEILTVTQNLDDLSDERKEAIRKLEEQAAAGSGGYSVGSIQGDMFMWPSDSSTTITSPFGSRPSPGGIGSTNHQGVDIGAAHGTNILAAASGYVEMAGWNGGYGNFVLINHGNGYYTAYAHMSSILVSVGENVAQGKIIGLVGSTGNSTGAHLHFEVRVNGSAVDPLQFF